MFRYILIANDDAARAHNGCGQSIVALRYAAALASFAAMLVLALVFAMPSYAAIQGDDYVGNTTVNDRGLNITEAPVISAKYGLLCDSNGIVLWSRKGNEQSAMASTTKIMTAIIALESGDLSKVYTVSKYAAETGGSTAYLQEGQRVSLEDLLYGLMLNSGNDAGVVISEALAGDEEKFVALMNEKAVKLGLKNTHYQNPHGLDADDHYSSANDLAVLARYAMQNPKFREIVSTKQHEVRLDGVKYTYSTTNALMANWDACIGVKTGSTEAAGQCLVSCASQDGTELYAVVLGSADGSERFVDCCKLLQWGFAHYKSYNLASAADTLVDVPMSGFLNKTVPAGVDEDVSAYILDFNGDVSVDVKLCDIPDGVSEGDIVGTITWRQGENVVATEPLRATESVGGPMPLTAVWTSFVRLLGLITDDQCIADSVLYAQTMHVEKAGGTAGQSIDGKLDQAIRAYVAAHIY